MPIHEREMKKLDSSLRAEALNALEKRLSSFITRDNNFQNILQNLSSGLATIFAEKMLRNKNISERVCHTIKEA